MPQSFLKDADANLDFSVDWGEWLAQGDAIAASSWTCQEGITILGSPAPTYSATIATAWLGGGTVDRSYTVTNRIVTALLRRDERTITITIKER